MRDSRAMLSRNLLIETAAALLALSLLAAPAFAEESSSPSSFLKRWLENQILGKDEPAAEEPAAPEPTGALPEGEVSEVPPPASELPDTATAPEAPPETPLGPDGDSALRGSEDMANAPPAIEIPPPPAREASEEDASAAVETGEPGADLAIPPASEARPEPLRFALLAGRSAAATMMLIAPVADDLGRLLERPVEFVPFPSLGAMIDAQVERRIDGGFFSAAAFALADQRCDCLEPLVAPRAFDGTLAYHAIIVARADSGIRSATDLEGKIVAIGAEDSLGGRRMQLAGLMSEGIDPSTTFASVIETESAEAAVALVAARHADAAFAWSSLAGSVAGGYSRGTLTDIVSKGAIAMPDLSIVWRSGAIEHGPFAVLRNLDAAEKQKIEAYFVALMSANPAIYDGLNPLYGGGYAPVDARDYAGLEVLVAADVDRLALKTSAPPATPAVPEDPPLAEAPTSQP
jgi:phosphonate transport system substrate-binding protein